jgi:hypothetical protein
VFEKSIREILSKKQPERQGANDEVMARVMT